MTSPLVPPPAVIWPGKAVLRTVAALPVAPSCEQAASRASAKPAAAVAIFIAGSSISRPLLRTARRRRVRRRRAAGLGLFVPQLVVGLGPFLVHGTVPHRLVSARRADGADVDVSHGRRDEQGRAGDVQVVGDLQQVAGLA